jgi:tetratricopeptide (TPR) repeat protein
VAELREGVVVAPSVWLLWHLLGNYLSDLDQVDEALEAYTQALACPRSDRATIHYNRAIAFRRADRYQEALAAADEGGSEPCLRLATGLRLALLNLLGRHEEALAAVDGMLAQLGEETDEAAHDRGLALGERAVALLAGRGDGAAAQREAERALADGSFVASAAEVLRTVRGVTSSGARGYRLRVQGVWPASPGKAPTGFLRLFQVIADTPAQALAYARDFEPEEARAALSLADVDEGEPTPEKLHGVYWASGHVFFPLSPEGSAWE